MLRIILAALLLGASLCASAQPYVPLQPGHAALPWHDADRPGEGLLFNLIPADELGDHTFFAGIYLADPEVTWYTAQGDRDESFNRDCPRGWAHCYKFDVYRTTGLSAIPDWQGLLWLHPGQSWIDWLLVIDNGTISVEAREGRLTTFGPVHAGVCDHAGGFPPFPPSAGEWCHD